MGPSPPPPPPSTWRALARGLVEWAPAALALVGALGARFWLRGAMDLRDFPGPSGPHVVLDAITRRWDYGWAGWFIASLEGVTGDVAAGAALSGPTLGGAAVLGAGLAGWAAMGRWGALGAIAAAGCWSIALWLSILVGPDTPAFGLGWLGVGLSWAGCRLSAARAAPPLGALPGVGIAAAGAALAVWGAAVKGLGMPTLAFLLVAPLWALGGRRSPGGVRALACAGAIAGGAQWARGWAMVSRSGGFDARPTLSVDEILKGLETAHGLIARGMPEGRFYELGIVAAVAALAPGPRWLRRALLGVGAAAALGLTASIANDGVTPFRPRYLAGASFGLVVLAGLAPGLAGWWLARLPGLRRLPGLPALPALALGGWLAADALAFLGTWDAQRVEVVGAAPAALPPAPAAMAERYEGMATIDVENTSETGAVPLLALAGSAPPGGLAIVQLRDERQAHAALGAALAGRPFIELREPSCCDRRQALPLCAEAVAEALDDAGARVVLPVGSRRRIERTPSNVEPWMEALREALTARGDWQGGDEAWSAINGDAGPGDQGADAGALWEVWDGGGEGGPLPCGPNWR